MKTQKSKPEPVRHTILNIQDHLEKCRVANWLWGEIESGGLGHLSAPGAPYEDQNRAACLRQICRDVLEKEIETMDALAEAARDQAKQQTPAA